MSLSFDIQRFSLDLALDNDVGNMQTSSNVEFKFFYSVLKCFNEQQEVNKNEML